MDTLCSTVESFDHVVDYRQLLLFHSAADESRQFVIASRGREGSAHYNLMTQHPSFISCNTEESQLSNTIPVCT
jgi:hypothetical protein